MTVVVATRLVPGHLWQLPAFLLGSLRAIGQAWRSPGFSGGRLRVEAGRAFWTLTVWETGREMAAYRDSGVHARVAPRAARLAKEAAFTVWQTPDVRQPSWDEVNAHLAERTTFAPLRCPSAAHRDQVTPAARPRGLDLPMPRGRRRVSAGR